MRTHTGILLLSCFLAPNSSADSLNGLRSAVTNLGDVNKDGVADLAVASRDRDRPERVWILSGKDGTRLLEIAGREPSDRFGSEVVAAGDWDGDGTPDVIISSGLQTYWARQHARGYRRIHSGKDGALLHEIDSLGAIGGGRDIDGDGRTELLLVVNGEIRTFSSAATTDGTFPPLRIVSGARDALTWTSDLDGDHIADLVEFEYGAERMGWDQQPTGRLTAHSGRDGSTLWSVEVRHRQSETGSAMLRSADFDGDGVEEIVLSSSDDAVRTYRGRDGAVLHEFVTANMGKLYSFPSSMDVLGDFDGDGIPELILGANEGAEWCFDAGLCRVLSLEGRKSALSFVDNEDFGFDVCAIGDVNCDGVPDFAIGAERQRGWKADAKSEPTVQVRSGKDGTMLWRRQHVDLREK